MKKIASIALAVSLMLAVLPSLAEDNSAPVLPSASPEILEAQPVASEKTLIVQGNATITAKPDYATLQIGVKTIKEKVDQAQEENARLSQGIIDAMKEIGVAEEDIVTSYFNLTAVYDYQYSKLSETQVLSGYQVENMLEVTVRSIDQISQVLDTCMKAGANQSYGISFHSSQTQAANDQALEAAIAEGARKAKLMAGASGCTLGELISVEEQSDGYYGAYAASKTMEASADIGTPILAGEVTVNAAVTLTYIME